MAVESRQSSSWRCLRLIGCPIRMTLLADFAKTVTNITPMHIQHDKLIAGPISLPLTDRSQRAISIKGLARSQKEQAPSKRNNGTANPSERETGTVPSKYPHLMATSPVRTHKHVYGFEEVTLCALTQYRLSSASTRNACPSRATAQADHTQQATKSCSTHYFLAKLCTKGFACADTHSKRCRCVVSHPDCSRE